MGADQPQISSDNLLEEIENIRLPEVLPCPECHVDLQLTDAERRSLKFVCPECSASFDITKKIENIRDKISDQTDEELIHIILSQEDYLIETVIAAKQEVVKRGLDIKIS